jgi:hypothetical protein
MPTTVFYSYARSQSDMVLPLAHQLTAVGIDVWVDRWRLVAGEPWDDAIMAAIGTCDAFMVALTRVSVTREEVKNEIAEALRRDKWIIPVLFEPCELPHRIARLQEIRLFPSFQSGLRKLLKDLGMTFDAAARADIEARRDKFLAACARSSNINHEAWNGPRQRFLDALATAWREDAPLSWYEVLEAGRELRDVMSRLPEGDDVDPHPGHASPIFSPLVMLTDAIDKNLSAAATGENLTGARAIGLLEQRVSEADSLLLAERRKLGLLDRQRKAAIDRARAVIAEGVWPALDRVRQTRDDVLVTAPNAVREAVEATAVAIGDLLSWGASLAEQTWGALQQVRQAAGAFIADTRRRFRAFRMVWTPSPATDALTPGGEPLTVPVSVRDGDTDETVHRVPGGGVSFQDGFQIGGWLIAGPEMVVVPAGELMMGSDDNDDEKPRHRVTIKAPFAVGRFAVTFDEWDAAGLVHEPSDQGWGRGHRPVINVSWEDAQAYVSWLSQLTGKAYRLLSEAEWEYCCRARTATKYWWGDAISSQRANYQSKSTVPVDRFDPNRWGLYQVHGNVWEWCEDNWHPDYKGAPQDGSVWPGGDQSLRVLRGGAWLLDPVYLRSALRDRVPPGSRDYYIGFRVARTL